MRDTFPSRKIRHHPRVRYRKILPQMRTLKKEKKIAEEQKQTKKKMEEIKQKKQNTDVKLWQKTKNLNELRSQERTKRTKKKCGLGSIIK